MCTRAPAGSVHTAVEHKSTLRRTIRGTRSTKTWLSVLATGNASLLLFAASSSGAPVRRCVRRAPGTACSSLPSAAGDTWTGRGRADLEAPLPAASGGGGSCQANDSWLTAMLGLPAAKSNFLFFSNKSRFPKGEPRICRFQIPDARSAAQDCLCRDSVVCRGRKPSRELVETLVELPPCMPIACAKAPCQSRTAKLPTQRRFFNVPFLKILMHAHIARSTQFEIRV